MNNAPNGGVACIISTCRESNRPNVISNPTMSAAAQKATNPHRRKPDASRGDYKISPSHSGETARQRQTQHRAEHEHGKKTGPRSIPTIEGAYVTRFQSVSELPPSKHGRRHQHTSLTRRSMAPIRMQCFRISVSTTMRSLLTRLRAPFSTTAGKSKWATRSQAD